MGTVARKHREREILRIHTLPRLIPVPLPVHEGKPLASLWVGWIPTGAVAAEAATAAAAAPPCLLPSIHPWQLWPAGSGKRIRKQSWCCLAIWVPESLPWCFVL